MKDLRAFTQQQEDGTVHILIEGLPDYPALKHTTLKVAEERVELLNYYLTKRKGLKALNTRMAQIVKRNARAGTLIVTDTDYHTVRTVISIRQFEKDNEV